jgi:phosphate transport system substrate-binding protein
MIARHLLGLGVVAALAFATPASAVDVRGAGATFPAPLYQAWIDDFREVRPDVRVSYDAVGSGEGVRRFVDGEVDFGASDAAMTDAEIGRVDGNVRLIPATAGMVALAYNLPNLEAPLKLSREVLAGIFLGEITHWQDERIAALNPGVELPSLTVARVVRRDASGTTFAFTNHLSAISEAWAERFGTARLLDWPGLAMTAIGNDGVAGRINVSWGAIGYVEQGFAARLGLPVAELENAAGNFVAPGPATGQAALAAAVDEMPEDMRQFMPDPPGADAYPIVTYSWLLLRRDYDDAAVGRAVADFARFGLTDGQASAAELGYIPLPDSVGERGLRALGLLN